MRRLVEFLDWIIVLSSMKLLLLFGELVIPFCCFSNTAVRVIQMNANLVKRLGANINAKYPKGN